MAFSSWRTWVTGETVTAAHMNQEVRDNLEALAPNEVTAEVGTTTVGDEWQAILKATDGDATVSADPINTAFYRVGAVVFAWARFVMDADVTETGNFYVELPVAAAGVVASTNAGEGQAIGSWQSDDAGAPASSREGGTVVLATSTTVRFNRPNGGFVTNGEPFAWTTDDTLSFCVAYPVA